MKKRLISLFLCLCLLGGIGTAYAAAGGAEDPLVSLSYLNNIFLPQLSSSIPDRISAALSALMEKPGAGGGTSGSGAVAVSAGGSVTLSAGQTVILLSGSARLAVSSGSVVNATLGAEVQSGAMKLNNRYIVCEDSSATVSILEDAAVSVSSGAAVTQGDGKTSPFKDVTREDWFFLDVVNAYERGLVNGMTAATYVPAGELTAAQAIKLAACMHQLYYNGSVTLKNSGEGDWFDSYVAYALTNGIISGELDDDDYNAPITRRDFVAIFYKALPATEYTVLNTIPNGAVPDVAMSDSSAAPIYAFYRAGILTGYTDSPAYEEHAFGPDSTITRAEVATIMNRMLDPSARRAFTLP